jgi:hypothetical protein
MAEFRIVKPQYIFDCLEEQKLVERNANNATVLINSRVFDTTDSKKCSLQSSVAVKIMVPIAANCVHKLKNTKSPIGVSDRQSFPVTTVSDAASTKKRRNSFMTPDCDLDNNVLYTKRSRRVTNLSNILFLVSCVCNRIHPYLFCSRGLLLKALMHQQHPP